MYCEVGWEMEAVVCDLSGHRNEKHLHLPKNI